ncbi:MAG TPA: lipid-A-disaccharide synthase [Thermoanaerobaculia bacterium]|nr:lipid-A-disaccharide synthase [Thermoanaerobaculia bacterium]
MTRRDLLVVAGEASGDLHAARLMRELSMRRPELGFFGLGSAQMREAGAELVADATEISVVGIVEALSVLGRARQILARLVAEAERRRPAAALLVDFPDFNLRLARRLHRMGIPVVYYVSPQIWAWRPWRVRSIVESVDRMLVLFPFEVPFYARHGMRAVHVGHPLVDEVPVLAQAWDAVPAGRLPERFEIALLPGSRRSEIASLLPLQLAALERIAGAIPVRATVVRAPSIAPELLAPQLERFRGCEVAVAEDSRFEAIAGAHLALCASGTATLETGLLGTPLVMLYRLAGLTWRLAQLLVRVPYASLVNLVLERPAVPELVQRAADPGRVAAEALALLASRAAIDRMRADLAELRPRLGRPGASGRAADEVLGLLDERERAA